MLDDIDVVASESPSDSYPSSSPGLRLSSASMVSPGDIECAACCGDVIAGGLVFGGGGGDDDEVGTSAAEGATVAAGGDEDVRRADEGSSPAIVEAAKFDATGGTSDLYHLSVV